MLRHASSLVSELALMKSHKNLVFIIHKKQEQDLLCCLIIALANKKKLKTFGKNRNTQSAACDRVNLLKGLTTAGHKIPYIDKSLPLMACYFQAKK